MGGVGSGAVDVQGARDSPLPLSSRSNSTSSSTSSSGGSSTGTVTSSQSQESAASAKLEKLRLKAKEKKRRQKEKKKTEAGQRQSEKKAESVDDTEPNMRGQTSKDLRRRLAVTRRLVEEMIDERTDMEAAGMFDELDDEEVDDKQLWLRRPAWCN